MPLPTLENNVNEPTPVGLFLQVDGATSGREVYQQVSDLIVTAEALGFHSARVTQHHFGERNGWLPSPLPFLAAVGQRAKRIRLGTVVVTIPLEQPLRLAEEAAVTDLLLDGRLELGLGSGLSADVFKVLNIDYEKRREDTRTGIDFLLGAFWGEAIDASGTKLQPPAPSLANRLWLGAMSEESVRYTAERGLGLLLGRVERGGGSPVENQVRNMQIYRDNLRAPARIGAGRTVYPAADRATAERDLAEALEPMFKSYAKGGFIKPDAKLAEFLTHLHVIYGHPEEIAETLAAEQKAIGWTELLVQIDPGALPYSKALRALERFSHEVVPYLNSLTETAVLAR